MCIRDRTYTYYVLCHGNHSVSLATDYILQAYFHRFVTSLEAVILSIFFGLQSILLLQASSWLCRLGSRFLRCLVDVLQLRCSCPPSCPQRWSRVRCHASGGALFSDVLLVTFPTEHGFGSSILLNASSFVTLPTHTQTVFTIRR